MRVKITKPHKEYKEGEVIEVSRNVAFGLIDSGYAIISKDITRQDIKETKNGSTSKLRSDYRRGR